MDKVASFRLYIPVKLVNGHELFMCDSSGKIRVYISREKLIKSVKNYYYIYCYDLVSKVK